MSVNHVTNNADRLVEVQAQTTVQLVSITETVRSVFPSARLLNTPNSANANLVIRIASMVVPDQTILWDRAVVILAIKQS